MSTPFSLSMQNEEDTRSCCDVYGTNSLLQNLLLQLYSFSSILIYLFLKGSDESQQEDEPRGRPKQRKRGTFSKMATNIMKAWLYQHLSVCFFDLRALFCFLYCYLDTV